MRVSSMTGRCTPQKVKRPNVAGTFYPGEREALRREVDACLDGAAGATAAGPAPKALIAPHAGYRYSGPVAASAYARLKPRARQIRRVVLLGPTHYHPIRGVAACGAESFETPFGRIAVDTTSVERVEGHSGAGAFRPGVREEGRMAGWPAGHWPESARAWRYTAEELD